MLGSRSNIAALSDGSEEAQNCSMLFEDIRDQILSMAWWNFARRTTSLNMVKAAPGTPEAWLPGTFNITRWFDSIPPAPWLYEYQYPSDCIQFRYMTLQPSNNTSAVPIFSTPAASYYPSSINTPQRFNVVTDTVNPTKTIQNISRSNPCVVTAAAHGLANSAPVWITSVGGMEEINRIGAQSVTVLSANTFSIPIDSTNFSAYGPLDYQANNGIVVLLTVPTRQNTLVTNASSAIGTYTMQETDLNLWGAQARQALTSALAGFLALPLSGDKNLTEKLINQANMHILSARASDGNEGYTVQDNLPDWIAVRSGYSMTEPSYAGMFYAPYPPLFAVS